jgi:hypothetical protein
MGYSGYRTETNYQNTNAFELYTQEDGNITWANSTSGALTSAYFEAKGEQEYILYKGDLIEAMYLQDNETVQLATKPVLGLTPYEIHAKNRLIEILEAMLRFAHADMPIPDHWDDEYDKLREDLNMVNIPQFISHE